jgi:hypothetical protein
MSRGSLSQMAAATATTTVDTKTRTATSTGVRRNAHGVYEEVDIGGSTWTAPLEWKKSPAFTVPTAVFIRPNGPVADAVVYMLEDRYPKLVRVIRVPHTPDGTFTLTDDMRKICAGCKEWALVGPTPSASAMAELVRLKLAFTILADESWSVAMRMYAAMGGPRSGGKLDWWIVAIDAHDKNPLKMTILQKRQWLALTSAKDMKSVIDAGPEEAESTGSAVLVAREDRIRKLFLRSPAPDVIATYSIQYVKLDHPGDWTCITDFAQTIEAAGLFKSSAEIPQLFGFVQYDATKDETVISLRNQAMGPQANLLAIANTFKSIGTVLGQASAARITVKGMQSASRLLA